MSNANWWARQLGNAPAPAPAAPAPAPYQTPQPAPQHQAPAPPAAGSVSDLLKDGAAYENSADYQKRKAIQDRRAPGFCPNCSEELFQAGNAAPRCYGCGYRVTSSGGAYAPGDNAPQE